MNVFKSNFLIDGLSKVLLMLDLLEQVFFPRSKFSLDTWRGTALQRDKLGNGGDLC